ncbi:hypothetical protein KP509_28G036000 [Ceratopteris richardii]|uniref:Galactose oxidase n=1 Tax=Ceratopteris richardii TaxID=49495 RepID=A0A8T2RB23_CERRI|nr:hypothetical protein KP509_28G036000 [Ceratopteris richardii]
MVQQMRATMANDWWLRNPARTSSSILAAPPFWCWLLIAVIVNIAGAQEQLLPGTWEVLMNNAGIASMHSAVTRFGTVVLLDRTDIGASQIALPEGRCRIDPAEKALKRDCSAHSVVFDPASNSVRPLMILTDTWCSSAQFLPDGTLLHTGGDFDGYRKIRRFVPCPAEDGADCDWEELSHTQLSAGRWYATNQILPDGRIIIIGGRRQFTTEFYPANPAQSPMDLPFLREVLDEQMDNLYPFVHLLPDGNLFIFANTDAVLYDYMSGKVVRTYPRIDGNPRNYPSGGSSAMLALTAANDYSKAEVLICGGAQFGAFMEEKVDMAGSGSCGRIIATDLEPMWAMEDMPFPRVMGDMVMLPTGDVLIINGAQSGSQGYELASNPCLYPLLYQPDQDAGLRFMTLTPAVTPRMYHSTANLLPDGRVLVAGSNPHYSYNFSGEFPTELKLEAFSPEYLRPELANLRPHLTTTPERIAYGAQFQVSFSVTLPVTGIVEANLASAPFSTHSFSQGQRLLKLAVSAAEPLFSLSFMSSADGALPYTLTATAPPTPLVAPPSFYMLFLVNQGVPSVATWVQLVSS